MSFDTDKEKLKAFRAENEIKWSMFSEYKKWKETNISKAYNIQWIPTMYLIDPEGKVAYTTVVAANMERETRRVCSCRQDNSLYSAGQIPGGMKALNEGYLQELQFPEVAKKYHATAKVKLSFIVDEEGNLSDITVKEYQGQPLWVQPL